MGQEGRGVQFTQEQVKHFIREDQTMEVIHITQSLECILLLQDALTQMRMAVPILRRTSALIEDSHQGFKGALVFHLGCF